MRFGGSSYISATGAVHMPVDRWNAVLPGEVLTQVARQRPNVLLVGPPSFTDSALKSIEALVQDPVAWWTPSQKRAVPVGAFATLFISRIDTADAEQQRQLCHWFELCPARVQVVSTAVTPVFPSIQAGTFLEALYYRLNHVVLADSPAQA